MVDDITSEAANVLQAEVPSAAVQGKSPVNTGSVLDMLRAKGIRPSDVLTPKQVVEETVKAVEDRRVLAEPAKEEVAEEPPVDIKPQAPVSPPVDPDDAELDKIENFKALRAKIKETKAMLKEREAAFEEVKTKASKYESGEELPESLKQREARISELERFEKVHSLKTSPAYKKAFVEPVQEIKQKLSAIVKDYGLQEGAVNHALSLKNRRDLNTFLTEHFDDVGALEVKNLVEQAQGITQKAVEAESEPAKIMAQIEAEHAERIEHETRTSRANIAELAVTAWTKSMEDIKKEGKLTDLIPRATDFEYNKKFIDPVVTAAAKEHGELVTALANAGLKELPPKLAYGLARMVQLAHASAINTTARNSMEKDFAELQENAARTTRYARPLSSGNSPSYGTSPEEGRRLMTPADAARMSREAAMGKR